MRKYLSAMGSRWKGLLVRKYGPLPILGAAIAAFLAVAAIFAENWLASQWQEVKQGWSVLIAAPIGFFGLLAFGILVALMLIAAFDTSPVAEVLREWLNRKKQSKPKPLGPDDKAAVAAIRGMWNTSGYRPAEQLEYIGTLLDHSLHTKGFPYLKYFRKTKGAIEEARTAFQTALAPEAARPLKDVQDSFVLWFGTYKDLIFEIARISHADLAILADKEDYVVSWRENHAKFYEKVEEMCSGWPEHGNLPVGYGRRYFFMIDDRITGDFVCPPEHVVPEMAKAVTQGTSEASL